MIGTGLAIIVNIEQYQDFLYAIGSVFAPLFAILLTDYFLLKNKKIHAELLVNWGTLVLCAIRNGLILPVYQVEFCSGRYHSGYADNQHNTFNNLEGDC